MATSQPVTHFAPSWRLVCQAGVFLGLVVGLSILIARSQLTEVYAVLHGVDRKIETVERTTQGLQRDAAESKTLVQSNNDLLMHHDGLTEQNAQLLHRIEALFAQIGQRQQEILQAIAHVHTTADEVRTSADTLTMLLQRRTQLLETTAQGVQQLVQQRCPAP